MCYRMWDTFARALYAFNAEYVLFIRAVKAKVLHIRVQYAKWTEKNTQNNMCAAVII